MNVDGGYLTFKMSFGGYNLWEETYGKDVKILAWDRNPIRKNDSPKYKEHRKERDDLVLQQVREMRDYVLETSRLPICSIENCEADDIVSVYYIFNPNEKIVGIDKDYFQLPRLEQTYNYYLEPYTKQSVVDKCPLYLKELATKNFALYQMLYGDSSDGIDRLLSKGREGKEQVQDILKALEDNCLADTLYNMFEDKILLNAKLVLFPHFTFGDFVYHWFDEWSWGHYYEKLNWEPFYDIVLNCTKETGPFQLSFEDAYGG